MTAICGICQFENSIDSFDSYQSRNQMHYECLDKTMCKQRDDAQRHKKAYGGLEKYGVDISDLEQLPHRCRCMQRSYFCKKNGKYYIKDYSTEWREIEACDIHKEKHFP